MGKIIAIVILTVVAVGAVVIFSGRDSVEPTPSPTATADPRDVEGLPTSTPVQTQTPTSMPSPPSDPAPTPTPAPEPTPSTVSFTIEADDSEATIESLAVNQNDTVRITFNVRNTNVYYGGLEFRGGPVDTGPIPPGGSKTVSFTALNSFTIIPYWPESNVRKNYNIQVNVN